MTMHRFSFVVEADDAEQAWTVMWAMVDEGTMAFDGVDVDRSTVAEYLTTELVAAIERFDPVDETPVSRY